jgi:hypothetical protein
MNKFAYIIITIITIGNWGLTMGQGQKHDHENSKSRGIEFFAAGT